MKNVLIFSDFGIDDMVAVIFALFCPEINIVGFVADYGNVSRKDAMRNAAYLQKITGVNNIPIFAGAALPLTGEVPEYVPNVHGKEGLGPIIPDLEIDEQLFGNFKAITDVIHAYENNLIVVNLGRLTSLATAFILFPNSMEKVNHYYIMGGAFRVPGNITPSAEANFYGDPYAAKIIINYAKAKLHFIPLDVTMSAIIPPTIVNSLHKYYVATKNHVGQLVKPMVDYYYSSYKKSNPGISGSPLHDLFTLWAVLDDSEIRYCEVPVQVVIDKGIAFGQSIGDFRKSPDFESKDFRIHKVALQFNYSSFIQSFNEVMMIPLKK